MRYTVHIVVCTRGEKTAFGLFELFFVCGVGNIMVFAHGTYIELLHPVWRTRRTVKTIIITKTTSKNSGDRDGRAKAEGGGGEKKIGS